MGSPLDKIGQNWTRRVPPIVLIFSPTRHPPSTCLSPLPRLPRIMSTHIRLRASPAGQRRQKTLKKFLLFLNHPLAFPYHPSTVIELAARDTPKKVPPLLLHP